MYTISIKLDMNRIPPEAFDALREKHHIWYKTYFDAGKFLMFGTRRLRVLAMKNTARRFWSR